jgi:hypothetical protein
LEETSSIKSSSCEAHLLQKTEFATEPEYGLTKEIPQAKADMLKKNFTPLLSHCRKILEDIKAALDVAHH